MFNTQVFNTAVTLPEDSQIIFVADFFANDLVGGAELTTEALIKSSPFNVFKLHSKDVTLKTLEDGHRKFWVFGNWAGLNRELIPTIVANMSYSVLEYDYKFCKFRSPEKHEVAEQKPCDCKNDISGKLTSTFYFGAKSLWWMSETQQKRYHTAFPFLAEKNGTVLSSVFEEDFWSSLHSLRTKFKDSERSGWIVLGSSSWIKGTEDAVTWCKENNHEYKILQNISPGDFLVELAKAEGLVYLPKGGDTCPRMVIEAKLLGCKLHLNNNVEHSTEDWFNTTVTLDTESYLYAARDTFWKGIKRDMEWRPTLSGYTTTRNCISQSYPYEDAINSMLGFCDEVVVVDSNSTDGTWERLHEIASTNEKLKLIQVDWDYTNPRFATYDGLLKAEARKYCTKDICWQMDADEVLQEKDYRKVFELSRNLSPDVDLVSLPVIEYWGSKGKARMDVTPWKWRLSRNKPNITHGIPQFLRQTDSEGRTYAKPGTDGCDYIDSVTGELIPHASFYVEGAHNARLLALSGNEEARFSYSAWFKAVAVTLPAVRHSSWLDIERKIKTYRNYWQGHWESLYDMKQEDTAENNMFFDKKWSEVTDEEITSLANRLATETGGHVFHTKINFSKPTPYLSF